MKKLCDLVSIIIPTYNVEKYISICLDNILKQTYQNIEIIIVDDGSIDKTKEIIKNYQKKDNRVKLFTEKNSGPFVARNYGISKSTGKYILFIDADDYLESNNTIQKLIFEIKEEDILLFPYIKEYDDCLVKKELFSENKIFSGEEKENILLHLFGNTNDISKLNNLSPFWGKLYTRKILELRTTSNLTYRGPGEDLLFNIDIFYLSKKIKYINDVFYHYNRKNNNSITRKYNKNLLDEWNYLYKWMNEFIVKNKLDNKYIIALNNRKILELFSILLNVVNSNLKFKSKILEIRNILNNELYREAFKNFEYKDLGLKWKVFYKLCYYKLSLLVYILLKISKYLKKFF